MRQQFTANLERPDGGVMFAKRPNPTSVSSQFRAGFLVRYRKERWELVRVPVAYGFTLPQWQSLRRGCSIAVRCDAMRCSALVD